MRITVFMLNIPTKKILTQNMIVRLMLKQKVKLLITMFMFTCMLGDARTMWQVLSKMLKKTVLHNGVSARQAARGNLRWPCLWATAGPCFFRGVGSNDPGPGWCMGSGPR